MRLSVVIPCYNEAKNLKVLFDRCGSLFTNSDVEVVFVNNGSTDDSGKIFAELGQETSNVKVVTITENHGYGYGILVGLTETTGEVIGWTHADLQTDPRDVLKALDIFRTYGSNIFVKGLRRKRPMGDVIFTWCMSAFETLLLHRFLWDINAQPTFFSRELYATIAGGPKDFSLDLFAYFVAKCKGQEVKRFDVKFEERLHGISHWNVDLRSKWKFIVRTIRYSVELKKGLKYGNY